MGKKTKSQPTTFSFCVAFNIAIVKKHASNQIFDGISFHRYLPNILGVSIFSVCISFHLIHLSSTFFTCTLNLATTTIYSAYIRLNGKNNTNHSFFESKLKISKIAVPNAQHFNIFAFKITETTRKQT